MAPDGFLRIWRHPWLTWHTPGSQQPFLKHNRIPSTCGASLSCSLLEASPWSCAFPRNGFQQWADTLMGMLWFSWCVSPWIQEEEQGETTDKHSDLWSLWLLKHLLAFPALEFRPSPCVPSAAEAGLESWHRQQGRDLEEPKMRGSRWLFKMLFIVSKWHSNLFII